MNKYFSYHFSVCYYSLVTNKTAKTEQKIFAGRTLSPKDLAASTLFKKIEVIP